MSRETVNEICAALPGAELTDPWGGGHDCWKLGGKMFAVTAARLPRVSVKTESAGIGERAPYLHKSWISLPLDAGADELRHRILVSYGLIRAGLSRKVQAALEPFAPARPSES